MTDAGEVAANDGENDRRDRELVAVAERIAPRFGRRELRERAGRYLRALTAATGRPTGRALAEAAGEPTPINLQRFLGRARWDADAVREDLREYVVDRLAVPGEIDRSVLIAGVARFAKKGTKSVGVTRVRIENRTVNCQTAVFLAYRTPRGCALIDRTLLLPPEWARDPDRLAAVGAPDTLRYVRLGVVAPAGPADAARAMIRRALDADLPCG
ncbi:transposase, partial [Alienimonas sp. DA493]|uniref:transposase n=1 Tax=Alienimonas sp. DA493 TaxID=3373605 RepID=UPI003754E09A